MSSFPLVSIVILNYNTGKLLEKCIKSIFESNYKNIEVIIVDNASTDKSYLECKKKYPDIEIIENAENLGYCEGNNVGIRKANGKFLVILNPDTEVTDTWLEELLKSYEVLGNGLYQPKLLSTDEKNRINTAGNMINLFGFGYSRGKGEIDNGQYDKIEKVDFASGACLFTTLDIMKNLGMFDRYLFAYLDDLDLGWRAALKKIPSYYIPSAKVYHSESFSFQWSRKKFFLLERNRWYCLLTHYSRNSLYKLLPSLLVIEALILFYYLSRGMIREKISSYADIIRNRYSINQKYKEIESSKLVPDRVLSSTFKFHIETPTQVANTFYSKSLNSVLRMLSRLSRVIL